MIFAFVGLGNMAEAIIRGMVQSGQFRSDEILGYNRSFAKTEKLQKTCGITPCDSLDSMLARADVIILCVKPQVLPEIIGTVAEHCPGKTVLSIAAGKTLDWYCQALPDGTPLIRVMPNINAKVGASSTALCGNGAVTQAQMEIAGKIFSSVGSVHVLPERLFPAFSAVCGASGAFLLLYLDALTRAGVREGFSRAQAQELALEAVSGCALLASETREHPLVLMDQICSPGGTTVEGVLKLKELGFEHAVTEGIRAIIDKDRNI